MAIRKSETVVGVFHEHGDAQAAIRALKNAGFTDEQIGIATSYTETGDRNAGELNTGALGTGARSTGDESYAGEGLMAGAATGAGLGALWWLCILAGVIPGIGPAIAGGTLAVLLSSAAAGAAAAGLAGALVGMGFTKEEAEYYESEMKAGRAVVAVNAGNRREEALRTLRQYGGYDITDDAQRNATRPVGQPTAQGGQTTPARDEKLRVDRTSHQAGEVKGRKEVHHDR